MNNNDMIIETIKEYVNDQSSNYAVLITGPWGIGKTYFAKNCLFNKLKDANDEKNIHYISLNGISDVGEIAKQIFYNLEILKSTVNTALTLASNFLPFLSNIDIKDISKFTEGYSIKLKNCTLIIDDYERCKCEQAEVLGYINQLVEHSGSKVIIIADEEKINDDQYKILKEKVIGYTLRFESDYLTVIDDLNKKYLDIEELSGIINENKNRILNVAIHYNHYNLRTYLFFLTILKRIYGIYPEKSVISFLIDYIFEISVRFKTNQTSEYDFETFATYVSNVQIKELITNLIYHGVIDIDSSKKLLMGYKEEISASVININDPVYILMHWDEYNNKEIINALAGIENSIEINKYNSDICSKIILYSCHLYENGFDKELCKKLCDKICEYLDSSSTIIASEIELPRLKRHQDTDYTFYEYYSAKIKQISQNKVQSILKTRLLKALSANDWGVQLEKLFSELSHVDNQDLYKYIDLKQLLKKIEECNQVQIKHFVSAIEYRYASSNYYQFLYDDLDFLNSILIFINNIQVQEEISIRYQLNRLKEKLTKYINTIKDYVNKVEMKKE